MISTRPFPLYKGLLAKELEQRCRKNPQYSLRAFARALQVDAAVLSRALTNQRAFSFRVATRVAKRLDLNPRNQRQFMLSVIKDQRHPLSLQSQLENSSEWSRLNEIETDQFSIIADWYHYAILELTHLKSFRSNPIWIARELGITRLQACLAITRLKRLGLLSENQNSLRKTENCITTRHKDRTTPAHRTHQRQMLEKAVWCLQNERIERRSMTGITMAIDSEKIPLARARIQEFSRDLCEFLTSGKRDSVYQLGIVLFPLQKEKHP